jgi:hypothetical protein
LFTMEEKRDIKRSCSFGRSSSSSSSDASMPPPSPSELLLPPVSPLDVSSCRLPSPVREHDEPSEEIPVVDLSSDEEGDALPDTSRDEEFARRLFGDLNRWLVGPPDDSNVIILSDSDEEEQVREEITVNTAAAPPYIVNSPTPSVSTADVPEEAQNDNTDTGDKAASP